MMLKTPTNTLSTRIQMSKRLRATFPNHDKSTNRHGHSEPLISGCFDPCG